MCLTAELATSPTGIGTPATKRVVRDRLMMVKKNAKSQGPGDFFWSTAASTPAKTKTKPAARAKVSKGAKDKEEDAMGEGDDGVAIDEEGTSGGDEDEDDGEHKARGGPKRKPMLEKLRAVKRESTGRGKGDEKEEENGEQQSGSSKRLRGAPMQFEDISGEDT